MQKLYEYIIEKLKLNSDSKIAKIRYLSRNNLPKDYNFDEYFLTKYESSVANKIITEIKNKISPFEILRNLKDDGKLLLYWLWSVYYGYENGYNVFRKEIIKKLKLSVDELDATLIDLFDICIHHKEQQNNIKKYFKEYNIIVKGIND